MKGITTQHNIQVNCSQSIGSSWLFLSSHSSKKSYTAEYAYLLNMAILVFFRLRPPRREDDSIEEIETIEDQTFPERVFTGIVRATTSAGTLLRSKSVTSVTSIKSKTTGHLKAPGWLKKIPCLRNCWKAGDNDGAGDGKKTEESENDVVSEKLGYGKLFAREEPNGSKKPGILKTPKDDETSGILKTTEEGEKRGILKKSKDFDPEKPETTTTAVDYFTETEEIAPYYTSQTNSENESDENEAYKPAVRHISERSVEISDVIEVSSDSDGARSVKKARFKETEEEENIEVANDDKESEQSKKKSQCCKWPPSTCTNAGPRLKHYCCIKLVIRCCGKKKRILFPRCCARLYERRLNSVVPKNDSSIGSYGDIVF